MATLKKSLKLHKLFVSELDRSARLEKEGAQVLSSLANVSRRLPPLLQATDGDAADADAGVLGVLRFSLNSRSLLLQKHFLALEKSRGFLTDILREYQDLLRRLRSFTAECVTLVDDALLEGEDAGEESPAAAGVSVSLQLLEWMQTVLAMLELETTRKTRLVTGLEYSDVERLSTVSRQWSAYCAAGNMDDAYVKTGLQLQSPQMKRVPTSASAPETSSQKSKKKKGKKSKK